MKATDDNLDDWFDGAVEYDNGDATIEYAVDEHGEYHYRDNKEV